MFTAILPAVIVEHDERVSKAVIILNFIIFVVAAVIFA